MFTVKLHKLFWAEGFTHGPVELHETQIFILLGLKDGRKRGKAPLGWKKKIILFWSISTKLFLHSPETIDSKHTGFRLYTEGSFPAHKC